MKVYEPQQIRNIALIGHASSGKTLLSEAILYETGGINKRGTIEEKNTISDHNEIEQERSCSLFATPLFTEYNDIKINIIDTPGYNDYFGEVAAALRVVDVAALVINAQNKIEVGAENAWVEAEKNKKPVMFIINKVDVEQAKFDDCISEIKDSYGNSATLCQFPLHTGAGFNSIIDILTMAMYEYPSGGGKPEKKEIPASVKEKADSLRNELIESVAETDEELMNKYFDNGELSDEDLQAGLKRAITARQIFPILCASGKNNIGTNLLIDFIYNYLPSPALMPPQSSLDEKEVRCDSSAPITLFVFKLFSEAHLGDMTFFRMYSGKMNPGTDLINEQKSSSERFNQLFIVCGKKRVEVESLMAGDFGASVKLKSTQVNNTLHEKGQTTDFPPINFPKPKVRIAVVPKTKGEEEKIGLGLNAICQEDPALKLEHSQELRQMILYGQGELHLSAARWRLEHRYKVEAEFVEPRVPYRETIQKQVRGSYRHKKQSGGAGQFAEVHMMVEPWVENMPNPDGITVRGKDMYDLDWGGKLEFLNCIVGGVIDQRFLPAILKGVMEKMQVGPLTGSYVRD
ncbi:MAG: elongation factor, partial [Bacteroidota bacterium]|nr:elongation factor [Bacteroidota bacterium]